MVIKGIIDLEQIQNNTFSMKKLFSLILAFCLLSPVIADDDFYDTAHKLATCSGAFEITSQLFSSLGGSDAETTVVQEKANGWLVASVVFFMTDGMTAEGSWSSAQGVKDTTISYWMARIESSLDQYASDDENIESLMKVVEELGTLVKNECIIYDEMVEEAIKVYRRMANSS